MPGGGAGKTAVASASIAMSSGSEAGSSLATSGEVISTHPCTLHPRSSAQKQAGSWGRADGSTACVCPRAGAARRRRSAPASARGTPPCPRTPPPGLAAGGTVNRMRSLIGVLQEACTPFEWFSVQNKPGRHKYSRSAHG
jgi:hypothetical protein